MALTRDRRTLARRSRLSTAGSRLYDLRAEIRVASGTGERTAHRAVGRTQAITDATPSVVCVCFDCLPLHGMSSVDKSKGEPPCTISS